MSDLHLLNTGMRFAQRLLDAMERAGFTSQAAMARACDVTPGAISQMIAANGLKMPALLAKVAVVTGVSVHWLRTGDLAEAPAWTQRQDTVREAALALDPRDRAALIRSIGESFAEADVEFEPELATAELAQLRADRALLEQHLRSIHRALADQSSALRAALALVTNAARELGVGLDAASVAQIIPEDMVNKGLAEIREGLLRAASQGPEYDGQHPTPTGGTTRVAP